MAMFVITRWYIFVPPQAAAKEKQMVTSVPEIVQHPRHADDEFVVVP